MNYRHAYHAGNFADVLKHLVLVFIIEHLKKKDKPFRVIDTHAGIGLYDLSGQEAGKTGEWHDGIGRLLGEASGDDAREAARQQLLADAIVARYVEAVASYTSGHGDAAGPVQYPGSPALAAGLLRPGDVLIANELHPDDADTLSGLFARNKQVKVLNLDGWLVPKSALPPKERRGVVLVDPPFEAPGEFDRMCRALHDGLRRFATGIFVFWYPIKDPAPVTAFKRKAAEAVAAPMLSVELFIRQPRDATVLNGCGLLIHTPPFGLDVWLEEVLPPLTVLLEQGTASCWTVTPISPASPS